MLVPPVQGSLEGARLHPEVRMRSKFGKSFYILGHLLWMPSYINITPPTSPYLKGRRITAQILFYQEFY
jgi:hypothetical protein